VNADVKALSTMLFWGVEKGLIGSNPLARFGELPDDSPKEGRSLEPAEVARLLDTSPAHWRDLWYALLVTGLRLSEMTGLRFSDVDWENRELVVRGRRAKNHTARRVPLDDS